MNPSYRVIRYAALVPPQLAGDKAMQKAYLTRRAADDGVVIDDDAQVTETPLEELEFKPAELDDPSHGLSDNSPLRMLRIEAEGYCVHQNIRLDHDVHAVNAASQVGPIIWLGEIRASCSNCHHRFLIDGRSVATMRLTPSDRAPE